MSSSLKDKKELPCKSEKLKDLPSGRLEAGTRENVIELDPRTTA